VSLLFEVPEKIKSLNEGGPPNLLQIALFKFKDLTPLLSLYQTTLLRLRYAGFSAFSEETDDRDRKLR
jgi:hypothetical protein